MAKKIFLYSSGILGLLLLIGLWLPKKYTVERSITIQCPATETFNYLVSLKNQNEWSVWAKRDPGMKKSYKGTDRNVGFVSAWHGNDDVGKGEQEIKAINTNKRIETEIRFYKPWETTNKVQFFIEAINPTTTLVRWQMQGKSPFPFNLLMFFYDMDSAIGKDFEDSLQNLRSILENQG